MKPYLDRMDGRAMDHPEVLLLRGDRALWKGDDTEGEALYREAQSKEPNRRARYRLAGVQLLRDDADPPSRLLDGAPPALATASDSASWWYEQGMEVGKEIEYAGLIAPMMACIECDPSRSVCYKVLGNALVGINRPDEALATLTTYLKFQPNDASVKKTVEKLKERTQDPAVTP
jgi:predicted Zn-dependent protease